MSIEIRMLKPGEAAVLSNIAPDVFDNEIDAALAKTFLADPRHHIAVALDGDLVVGMATAVDYVHPDKPLELWINEVGTASTHRGQGIGKKLMATLLAHGRSLGCTVAWVLTETDNTAARALYAAAGGKELSLDTVHVEFEL